MPQIYQRAWVTISASTANDATRGFLQDRGYLTAPYEIPISLPYVSKDGVSAGAIVLSELTLDKEVRKPHGVAPIHQRAWTYQERRLSPRVLDFTHRNLTFICRTGKFSQGDGSKLWSCPRDRLWDQQQGSIPCSEDQELPAPAWHSIIEDYVKRKLTFPSDKLKAIAALADLYRLRTKYTYVAGLWRETLLHDLCWLIRSDSYTSSYELLPRPSKYRAPSRSWAAIDLADSMKFHFIDEPAVGSDYLDDGSKIYTLAAVAEIVDVSLQQDPPQTAYGQIYTGHLILEGLALSTDWFYNQERYGLQWEGHRCVVPSRDARENEWGDEPNAHATVTALILMWGKPRRSGQDETTFGLLLLKVAEEKYRRVGTFSTSIPRDQDTHDSHRRIPDINSHFKRQKLTIV